MSAVRKVALVIMLGASSRTETAYLAKRPLARYAQITEDDLAAVSLPVGRPAEFQVVTDKAELVGRYAANSVAQGELFVPALVVASPPELRVFSTGKELPEGMRGFPLTLASDLAPVLREDDLVDVVLVDPEQGTATWLLSNVEPLAILAPKGDATATYILALTPEQAAYVEGALADNSAQQAGYAKLYLSQDKNTPVKPGTVMPYRDLSPAGVQR
jgi:hypothetical protein